MMEERYNQTPVSFQTEDGWTIRGILFLPETLPTIRVPGVVIAGDPGKGSMPTPVFRSDIIFELQRLGMVSLFIDLRGNGRSLGKRVFENLSPKEIDGFQLDIRAAIKFLASQKSVDPQRIGIVAPGLTANYAVLEASENPAVQAIVLRSGRLSAAARDYIKFREELPIFYLANSKDKVSFREMADAYSESKNVDSVFMLPGKGLYEENVAKGPNQDPGQWLSRNLAGLGIESKESFQSSDGWVLHGHLYMPPGASKLSPVAGVVLVHGAGHDQKTFYYLARDLVKNGLAVLTFDWRGKGESADDEKWVFRVVVGRVSDKEDRTDPQLTNPYLDVKAATEFLATREGIDPARIGLLGATWTTSHVIRAAVGDARIKTIILLSPGGGGGVPETEITRYLTTNDVPILTVTSEDDLYPGGLKTGWIGATSDIEVSRKLYLLSKSKYSQLLVYSHGAHGSRVFDMQPEARPTIVRWFTEKLDSHWLKGVSSSK